MIELTDAERVILANQYEILAKLHEDNESDNKHYKKRAEQLRDGHKWLYQQAFDSLSPNLSDEDAEYVLKILGIYADMKASYDRLSDKSGITEHDVTFIGFDGNNECELMSFACALLEDERYTDVLSKQRLNSHSQTSAKYRRLIANHKALGEPHFPLSKEQLLQLIA